MSVEINLTNNKVTVFTGTVTTLVKLMKPRFTYKDNNEPLSHRFVLYWQYDQSRGGFNLDPEQLKLWNGNNQHMPIGLGRTDGDGRLVPGYHPPGFKASDRAFDTENYPLDRTIHYRRPGGNPNPQPPESWDIQKHYSKKTVTGFSPNLYMGFML